MNCLFFISVYAAITAVINRMRTWMATCYLTPIFENSLHIIWLIFNHFHLMLINLLQIIMNINDSITYSVNWSHWNSCGSPPLTLDTLGISDTPLGYVYYTQHNYLCIYFIMFQASNWSLWSESFKNLIRSVISIPVHRPFFTSQGL